MRSVRPILQAGITIFLVLVVLPLVTEFVIELAREQGFFEKPSAKIEAILSATSTIIAAPWFQTVLGVALGGTLFMWIDYFLRRSNRQPIRPADPETPFYAQTYPPVTAEKTTWRFSPANYEKWDDVDEFLLFQAAYLWGGLEPLNTPAEIDQNGVAYLVDPESQNRFVMLYNAVKDGRIDMYRQYSDGSKEQIKNPKWFDSVDRKTLFRLAESIYERPPFLYPEFRNEP